MEVWFHNPWAMIEDGVIYTLDQVDLLNPIKRFPNDPWTQHIAYQWYTKRLIALPKSRRMMITWLMIFLHLHLAMFNEGVNVFFVSDKEDKSDELVKRAEFIIKYIPEDQMLKPRYKGSYCYLDFPGLNSSIQGVPMGADQLRQFTATAIFADEFAFWERARETYMASIPTIQGGGRFTAVSSAQVGFFKDVVFDQVR
jgi:phage FluMu gp28-like protein